MSLWLNSEIAKYVGKITSALIDYSFEFKEKGILHSPIFRVFVYIFCYVCVVVRKIRGWLRTSIRFSREPKWSWLLPTATRSWSSSTWTRVILPNSIGSTRTTNRLSTHLWLSISLWRRWRQLPNALVLIARLVLPLLRLPPHRSHSLKNSKPRSKSTVSIKTRNSEIDTFIFFFQTLKS